MITITEELSNYKNILSEGNCKFCHKPVDLIPSASSRAKKYGGNASDYIAMFPNHAECELANRKKDDLETAAKRREADANSKVILKKTMKESALLKWRVSSIPTGRYRSFEKRMWPSAEYQNGSPAVQLICTEPYSSRTVNADNLEFKIGLADHSDPSNKETGAGFTWKYLKQRATSLAQAKILAQTFLQNNPTFAPKSNIHENIVTEYQNPAELPSISSTLTSMDLGKQVAMEEFSKIIAGIPEHQKIPYKEFVSALLSTHRTCKKDSDEKVINFTRGWNSILLRIYELVPKSREKSMTKSELELILSMVGQKELKWN